MMRVRYSNVALAMPRVYFAKVAVCRERLKKVGDVEVEVCVTVGEEEGIDK